MSDRSYGDVAASDRRVFTGITDTVVDCLKKRAAEFGIRHPDGDSGQITLRAWIAGDVALDYALNRETRELTLTIARKPLLVPKFVLWNKIAEWLNRCKQAY